jgi:hypothetical protein
MGFMTSDKKSRMAALLDRLNVAQRAVTGPPPTRISFSKLAEWCAGAAGISADDVYRDLLQSYLSGAFEHTLVFYLTNLAPDLSETDLIGYRMSRDFLAARVRSYSIDHDNEAAALFSAYLKPCWVHRSAAVRWLEGGGHPVPSQWMATSGSADEDSKEQPAAAKKSSRPREAPTFERVINDMSRDIDEGKWTIEKLLGQKKSVLAAEYNTSETTAYDAAHELERRLASRSQSRDQERPRNSSD